LREGRAGIQKGGEEVEEKKKSVGENTAMVKTLQNLK
jgi:hypothetical protein